MGIKALLLLALLAGTTVADTKSRDAKANDAANTKAGDCIKAELQKLKPPVNDVKTATKEQLAAVGATCRKQAGDAAKAAGGDADTAIKDAQRDQGVNKMKECVGKEITDMSKATAAEVQAAQKKCTDEAKAQFEAAGGDAKNFADEVRKGATKQGADKFGSCFDTELAALKKTLSELTAEDKEKIMTKCKKEAEEAAKAAGANVDDIAADLARGAKNSGADKMKECFDKAIPDFSKATDAEKDAARKACLTAAADAIEKAGGDRKDAAEDLKRGAQNKLAEKMDACVKNQLTTAGKKAADDAAVKAAVAACTSEAKKEFEASGGKAKDFEKSRMDGAAGAAADAFKACVNTQLTADGTTISEPPTQADQTAIKAAATKAGCDAVAKEAYGQAGGKVDDFDAERQRGAGKAGSEQTEACLKGKGAIADDAAMKKAQSECFAKARDEFIKAGGKLNDFEDKIKEAAQDKGMSSLRTCVEGKLNGKTASSIDRKTMDTYAKECEATFKAEFTKSGGDPDKLKESQRDGRKDLVADEMKSCIEGALTVDIEKATAAQKDAAKKTCGEQAKEKFLQAGGKPEDYDAERLQGAKDKLAETVNACLKKELGNVDKVTGSSAADLAKANYKCGIKAKKEFESRGGNKDDARGAQLDGAKDKGGDAFKTCVEAALVAAGKTITKTKPTDEDRAAIKNAAAAGGCDDKAKEAFAAGGGNANEWKELRDKAAGSKAADAAKTCFNTEMEKLSLDIDTATDAQKSAAKAACAEVAKAEFLQAGGDNLEFDEQRLEGAKSKAASAYAQCLQTQKLDGKDAKASKAACDATAKKEFEKNGGPKGDVAFQKAKGKGQEDAGRDAMKMCVEEGVQKLNGLTMCACKAACDAAASSTCDTDYTEDADGVGSCAILPALAVTSSKAAMKCKDDKAVALNNIKPANEDGQIEAAKKGCMEAFKKTFQNQGGSAADADVAMHKAARGAGKDKRDSCIDAALAGVTNPTDAQINAQLKNCDTAAKAEFKKAGGSDRDWDVAKRNMPTEKFKEAAEACVEAKLVDKADPSDADIKAAFKACEAAARAEFKKQGGKDGDFQASKKAAEKKAGGDAMKACVGSAIEASGVKTDEALKAAQANCRAQVEKEFLKNGGDKSDLQKKLREAGRDAAGDKLKACVEGKVGDITGLTAAEIDAAVTKAKKECSASAKEDYVKNGGKPEDFFADKKKGVATKVRAKMETCISAELKKACVAAFNAAAGGGVDAAADTKCTDAPDTPTTLQNKCTAKGTDAATCSTNVKTQMQTAIKACVAEADLEHKLSGGDTDKASKEKSKKEGQRTALKEHMEACVAAALEGKSKTVDTATAAEIKAEAATCKAAAKEKFQMSGGDEDEAEEAEIDASSESAKDTYDACQADVSVADKASCDAKADNAAISIGDDVDTITVAVDDTKTGRRLSYSLKGRQLTTSAPAASDKSDDVQDETDEALAETITEGSEDTDAATADKASKQQYTDAVKDGRERGRAEVDGAKALHGEAMKLCVKAEMGDLADAADSDARKAALKTAITTCKPEADKDFDAVTKKPAGECGTDMTQAKNKACGAGKTVKDYCTATVESTDKTCKKAKDDAEIKKREGAGEAARKKFKACLKKAGNPAGDSAKKDAREKCKKEAKRRAKDAGIGSGADAQENDNQAESARASACMKKAAAVARKLHAKCKTDGACKDVAADVDGASNEDLDAGTKQIVKGVKDQIEKAVKGCVPQDIDDDEFKNKVRNYGKRTTERKTGKVKGKFESDKTKKLEMSDANKKKIQDSVDAAVKKGTDAAATADKPAKPPKAAKCEIQSDNEFSCTVECTEDDEKCQKIVKTAMAKKEEIKADEKAGGRRRLLAEVTVTGATADTTTTSSVDGTPAPAAPTTGTTTGTTGGAGLSAGSSSYVSALAMAVVIAAAAALF